MKPVESRRQLLAAAGGAVVVVGGILLAWLGLNHLGEKQAEAQALADRMGQPALAALLAHPDGAERALRDAMEIQKLGKNLSEQDQLAEGWSQATRELAGEGMEWAKDPGKWKDRLIAVQSQLQKDAKESRVELVPDFYLGLESYRQKSPTAEEVPALALHLSVAERLVRLLMQARKAPEQFPTACNILALVGPGSSQEKQGEDNPPSGPPAGGRAGSALSKDARKSFRVEIRVSPEVLYEYVRLLAGDPAPLIITDLAIVNDKQTFPLRSEIAKKFLPSSPSDSGVPVEAKNTEQKLLEILAGKESLNITMDVDFVAWKKSDASQAPAPATPSP